MTRQEDWFRAALAKCDRISKTKERELKAKRKGVEEGAVRGWVWQSTAVSEPPRFGEKKQTGRQREKGFLFCFVFEIVSPSFISCWCETM